MKVTEVLQRIPWVVYEECSECRLAHTRHLGGICCPTALTEGTGRHLEDAACPGSCAALALWAPFFSGRCEAPLCSPPQEGKLPARPGGPHMIGNNGYS